MIILTTNDIVLADHAQGKWDDEWDNTRWVRVDNVIRKLKDMETEFGFQYDNDSKYSPYKLLNRLINELSNGAPSNELSGSGTTEGCCESRDIRQHKSIPSLVEGATPSVLNSQSSECYANRKISPDEVSQEKLGSAPDIRGEVSGYSQDTCIEDNRVSEEPIFDNCNSEAQQSMQDSIKFDKWLVDHKLYKEPYTTPYNYERQLLYQCFLDSKSKQSKMPDTCRDNTDDKKNNSLGDTLQDNINYLKKRYQK